MHKLTFGGGKVRPAVVLGWLRYLEKLHPSQPQPQANPPSQASPNPAPAQATSPEKCIAPDRVKKHTSRKKRLVLKESKRLLRSRPYLIAQGLEQPQSPAQNQPPLPTSQPHSEQTQSSTEESSGDIAPPGTAVPKEAAPYDQGDEIAEADQMTQALVLKAADQHPLRPGILVPGARLMPTPEPIVPEGRYDLDEDQLLDVNAVRTNFKCGGKAFMLGSGAGVGKTRIILAAVDSFARDTGKPVLIITKSRAIIDGPFELDRMALSLPPFARLNTMAQEDGLELAATRQASITIGTYSDLDRFWVEVCFGNKSWTLPHYGVVVFDEAHALKYVDRAVAAARIAADHILYATATPMDRPDVAAYFLHQLTGKSQASLESLLGFEVVRGGDGRFGICVSQVKGEPPRNAWQRVLDNIVKMRNEVVGAGRTVRREYPFWGNVDIVHAGNLGAADAAEQKDIIDYWDRKGQLDAFAFWKLEETGCWLEPRKLPFVLAQMDGDLKAGRSVVIMAEGINERKPLRSTGLPVAGFISEIEKALTDRGIEFARIYEDNVKAAEVQKFQANRVRVALTTPASGAIGTNLDDVHGGHPRTMYLVTPALSGGAFD